MLLAGLTYSNEILFQGFVDGLVYALVALGLVLIYRATGVINFAQGAIGAFGGFTMAILIVNYDLPYWLAALIGIGGSTAVSTLTELLVVRRLFSRPRLLLFVATLGVSQLVALLQVWLPTVDRRLDYPTLFDTWCPEPTDCQWEDVGGSGILLRREQLMVLVIVPLLVACFAFLMQKTRFGLSVRSAADNPNAAQLAGVSIRTVSTQVWLLAGMLTGISTLLIGPIRNLDAGAIGSGVGPTLLMYALAAAMFGGLRSFPKALLGGIIVGIVDRMVLSNNKRGFLADADDGGWGIGTGSNLLAIAMLILGLMLFLGRSGASSEQAWTLAPRIRGAREELVKHPLMRWLTWGGFGFLLVVAVLLPRFVEKATRLQSFAEVLIILLVALSAVVLTGWAGQLSLAQFAFAGVGAYMTVYYAGELNYFVALALGVVWGMGIAVVVGIPALRLRGLFLAVATLAFALLVERWLLLIERLGNAPGGGAKITPPEIFGRWDLRTDKQAYYYMCLVAVLVVLYMLSRLRRSGVGRSMIAIRDNEEAGVAYTISPTKAKLMAFAISGGIAALAGGLLVPKSGTVRPGDFPLSQSLLVMSIAVVGGISSLTGAVLGTVVLVAIPTIFESSAQVRLFASGLGMLVVLMYFPGGLISLLHNARDLLMNWVAERTGWTPPAKGQNTAVGALSARTRQDPKTIEGLALETRNVSVQFGGRNAVSDVSIEIAPGEIVGLIGTNGAGKTTLMNAISGFVPSTGEVDLYGKRIDNLANHKRARMGLGRAFQNAKLFGSLTVRETLMTALEARERSLLLPSMLGMPPSPFMERRKRKQAEEIIHYLGLGRYADQLISELSTGTRRIVELGALIALDTKLMLLDEPTAGVAQKETEAFGPLIHAIKDELGSSILLIEHDMPMVMSISDRIYCMEAGKVISTGDPLSVRNDPAVIASYLGTDERAIQRSGAAAENPAE